MAYFKKIPSGNDGKISYTSGIVKGIVILAISEIEGVKVSNLIPGKTTTSKAIKISMDKTGINVDVNVMVDHNCSVSDMAFKIQENIKHNVESMTEYHIGKVNVNVTDVTFDEETTVANN